MYKVLVGRAQGPGRWLRREKAQGNTVQQRWRREEAASETHAGRVRIAAGLGLCPREWSIQASKHISALGSLRMCFCSTLAASYEHDFGGVGCKDGQAIRSEILMAGHHGPQLPGTGRSFQSPMSRGAYPWERCSTTSARCEALCWVYCRTGCGRMCA